MRDSSPSWSFSFRYLAALVGLLAVFTLLVGLSASPPAVVPATAPATDFSAARALEVVRGLAQSGLGRPTGSAEQARARGYLEERLRALGLKPRLARAHVCRKRRCADVENLVSRIEGEEPGPALLLVAHYDSVPVSPGAADDGAGVATVLETARALLAGPKPTRPVLLLLDDGEELGLLGAQAFVDHDTAFRDVGVVLNFDARGTAGQTAMFETSDASADLVALYARAASRPVTSSVIVTLYKTLPNDTDLTVFKAASLRGLNFAFADRVWDYHTANDTVERLDPRSLQHMGDLALSTARAVLAAHVPVARTGEAVYFDVLSLFVVLYPEAAVLPLAALAVFTAVLVVGFAVRRRHVSLRGVFVAAALTLGLLVAAVLGGYGISLLIEALGGTRALRTTQPLVPWTAQIAAAAAASTAIAAALQRLCFRTRWAGAVVAWALFSLGVAFFVKGASYLFTLPALALALSFFGALGEDATTPAGLRAFLFALVPLSLTALLWMPMARIVLVMVGALVGVATALPIGLLVTISTPPLSALHGRLRWAVPVASAVIALSAAILSIVHAR